ncbi:hypothetical protein GCM10011326_14360 [Salipiger profundus]|nr:hypothetical protein GCM10011326_14360 [Salipiger profundus]
MVLMVSLVWLPARRGSRVTVCAARERRNRCDRLAAQITAEGDPPCDRSSPGPCNPAMEKGASLAARPLSYHQTKGRQ